ncbi:prepilin-type N-terminal cleavage/methylation domain-containing protein [Candidatus Atribacteria bacterium 1244-E10-H5-B2]|nr:MAG: prepilin-type N-terminal cleavage/methylation domain-containing protein [Candidatus Atribacteria bacterium 1244-E10-H5-B2]
MLHLRKSKWGFTLIELMVVVAIIGVLALLGLRLYTGQQQKAKNAVVKANVGTIQTLIQAELADTTSDDVDIMVGVPGGTDSILIKASGIHIPDGGPQTANGTETDITGIEIGMVYVVYNPTPGDVHFKINGHGFPDSEPVYTESLTARK